MQNISFVAELFGEAVGELTALTVEQLVLSQCVGDILSIAIWFFTRQHDVMRPDRLWLDQHLCSWSLKAIQNHDLVFT